MEPVVGGDVPVAVGVEPLSALGVPGQAQGLETAAGKGHQVLLEWLVAEGVGDLELAHLAPRPLGPDQELAVAAIEAGGDAEVGDLDAVRAGRACAGRA